jgi:hypothetical protein
MTIDEPLVLRVDAPRELLESVPHLVGFVPYDSLVLLLFRTLDGSSRERVELTMRIDLPAPASFDESLGLPLLCGSKEFSAAVDRAVGASGATTAVVVAWGVDPARGDAPVGMRGFESLMAADVTACARLLATHGVHVRDVLLVSGHRFRSLLCHDATCCPSEGSPFSSTQSSSISAHVVASGRAMPAGDRRAVEAEVALDPGRAAETERALGLAAGVQTDALVRAEAIPGLQRPRAQVRHLADAIGSWDLTGALSSAVMARLAVGLGRGTVREHAVRWMVDGGDGIDHRRFWLYVARGLPAPYDAPALALGALGALLEGNGAAANIAFDRAFAALHAAEEPVDGNVFAALVYNVGFLVHSGCAPEVARTILSSAYSWFTPLVVPVRASTEPTRRASGE